MPSNKPPNHSTEKSHHKVIIDYQKYKQPKCPKCKTGVMIAQKVDVKTGMTRWKCNNCGNTA